MYVSLLFPNHCASCNSNYASYFSTYRQQENGYSDNPDDDNYCPYPLNFNHNGVLHVCQMIGFTFIFLGVWRAMEEISSTVKAAHELQIKTTEGIMAVKSETVSETE